MTDLIECPDAFPRWRACERGWQICHPPGSEHVRELTIRTPTTPGTTREDLFEAQASPRVLLASVVVPEGHLGVLCDRRVWPSSSGRGRLHRPCARTRRC